MIKSRRKALKMTQDDLALLVGVSRVSVSQWERGDTSPKGGNFLKLASALGLAPESLMQGSEAGSVTEPKRGYHNVELAVIPRGSRVPILSYVQAGNWREMCEQATTFDGNVEYVTASVDIGPCGFGLWLRGNSLTLTNSPALVISWWPRTAVMRLLSKSTGRAASMRTGKKCLNWSRLMTITRPCTPTGSISRSSA